MRADLDRHARAVGEAGERRVQPAVGEHGGMDAPDEVAQLAHRPLGLLVRGGEDRVGAVGIRLELAARPPELHADVGQPVLRAVVQVALDLAQPRVGGVDGGRPGRLERRDPRGELAAVLRGEHRLGERPEEHRETAGDQHRGGEQHDRREGRRSSEAGAASPRVEPSGAQIAASGATSAATAAE